MRRGAALYRIFLPLFLLAGMTLSATTVKGIVRGQNGEPLAGVKITVQEEGRTFVTDGEGRFRLVFADGRPRVRLIFAGPGIETTEVVVEARDFSRPLTVSPYVFSAITEQVTVTAPRAEMPMIEKTAATSVISGGTLASMPRSLAADEALNGVPGVKVDNQANGERVHLSIRGQGILTERGIRGIQILLDGIPLNDPSGFAPDLFDVDWATVEKIEVLRGPMGFLYGGGSAGGVISITTRDGTSAPLGGTAWTAAGSYGFWKGLAEAGGRNGRFNYRLSASHGAGDGYRDHTAFWANNLYGKLRWEISSRFTLTGIVAGMGFFNENAEGLNLKWLHQNRRQANPDANTYNEFQKTRRLTAGIHGFWQPSPRRALSFTVYGRSTLYLEAVPSSVQHRSLFVPGFMVQYQVKSQRGFILPRFKNHFSAGIDLDWQGIGEFRRPNLGGAREGDTLLSDQDIRQNGLGAYLTDRLEISPRWSVQVGVRLDSVRHSLADNLQTGGVDLSGKASFNRATARMGVAWTPGPKWSFYVNWGLGFLPPATEELYANPEALGGFNAQLKPATSSGGEVGVHGNISERCFYDLALFHLDTHNDFERFRIAARPLETFYRNAGNSRRNGLEVSCSWFPVDALTLALAYTYSDFRYSDYQSTTYPGNQRGHWLPNSPRHKLYADASCRFARNWFVGVSVEGNSRAAVDASNAAWIDGYLLLGSRLGYRWAGRRFQGEVFLSGKNVTATEYIAFTEPDPDGNSYQPGPTREFFATLRLSF